MLKKYAKLDDERSSVFEIANPFPALVIQCSYTLAVTKCERNTRQVFLVRQFHQCTILSA